MELTLDFKNKTRLAVLEARQKFDGTDEQFAKALGLNAAVYSRLKKGEIEGIISNGNWLSIARKYQVKLHDDKWKVVKTDVYLQLEDSLKFCQQFSKSMIFSDECDIGKSFCTRHILKSMKNAFYIDASQAKTRQQFTRALAKIVGIDSNGKYIEVKENLKYALNNLPTPIVVIDEAGDADYPTYLDWKEYWNATEGYCAWYLIGADGLQTKLDKGIKSKKVGFAEILSRFSDEIIKIVPTGKDDRDGFFMKLVNDVALANVKDASKAPALARQCVKKGKKLRHLDTLIKMGA